MPGKPRIMVVGSSNTDMVIKAGHLPAPGETVIGGEFRMVPGGKGANQAVAAARLGAAVWFVARVGIDVFGDTALENFRREGMHTEFVARDSDRPSGVALINVDCHGENSIAVAPGANLCLSPEDVDRAREVMANCSAVVMQLEIPLETVGYTAGIAHEQGVKVILNPAPVGLGGVPKEILRLVEVLVPNESEARALMGLAEDTTIDESSASRILDLGVGSAVITLGSKGSLVVEKERVTRISAIKVEAVDTTAAGDAFTGALSVALSSGMELVDAARFATRVAALSVTRMGAQSSLPTMDDLAQFNKSK